MDQNRRKDFLFIGVVSLVHIAFYLLALQYKKIFNGDSFGYILEAFNIKDHSFFYIGKVSLPIIEEYKTLRTPGYPLFLLATYIFSINNWIVLLLQNVVSIFNIVYARKILFAFGFKSKYDWLLILFIVSFPSQFIYASTIAPDILLQTFVLIYFRHVINFLQQGRLRSMCWMSIALTLGLFVKPVLYPYAFLHLVVFGIYVLGRRVNSARALLVSSVPVLCIVAYSTWNYMRTDKYHFTSNQSFNALFYYNNFQRDELKTVGSDMFMVREREKIDSLPSFRERYNYSQNRGVELLKQNFFRYLSYHFKMSARFFVETGKGEIEFFTGKMTLGNLYAGKTKGLKAIFAESGFPGVVIHLRTQPVAFFALLILVFNILRTIGVFLFIIYCPQRKIVKWFVALFLLYFALITGPISNAHYVLPVSLILIGCAVVGYSELLTARNNKGIITS